MNRVFTKLNFKSTRIKRHFKLSNIKASFSLKYENYKILGPNANVDTFITRKTIFNIWTTVVKFQNTKYPLNNHKI